MNKGFSSIVKNITANKHLSTIETTSGTEQDEIIDALSEYLEDFQSITIVDLSTTVNEIGVLKTIAEQIEKATPNLPVLIVFKYWNAASARIRSNTGQMLEYVTANDMNVHFVRLRAIVT